MRKKKVLFEEFLAGNKDRLFGYAYYLLRDREEAEDVTQEIFIRLWESWDSIERSRMHAWIMKVAHNRCMDLLRRRKRRARAGEILERSDPGDEAYRSRGERDPELEVELAEEHTILLRAMASLKEDARSILLMRYFQGLNYEVIAEILNSKPSTVKVRVHRARETLRRILYDNFPGIFEERPNG